MVTPRRRAPRPSEAGYNLVILLVLVTIMNVMAAAAMPLWSTAIRRDREEELIFRGFQYAEAIRVFQRRFGRQPVRLEELIEVQPRCIRQLWKDPMTEDGKWGLIYADAPQEGAPGPGQAPPVEDPEGRPPEEGEGGEAGEDGGSGSPEAPPRVGPIVGVYSKSGKESIKVLFGQQRYRDWKFSTQLFGMGGIGPEGVAPGVRSIKGLGRPFRHDAASPTTLDPEGREQ